MKLMLNALFVAVVLSIFLGGCANPYLPPRYNWSVRSLDIPNIEDKKNYDGVRIVIRYPADNNAPLSSMNSAYSANVMYKIARYKFPNAVVLLDPVRIEKVPGRNYLHNEIQYKAEDSIFVGLGKYDLPGATVYIDIYNPAISDILDFRGVPFITHAGDVYPLFEPTYGRWSGLKFSIYTNRAMSPKTNGILAFSSSSSAVPYKCNFGITQSGLVPFFPKACSTTTAISKANGYLRSDDMADLITTKAPVSLNKAYVLEYSTLLLDESKIAASKIKSGVNDFAEYDQFQSILNLVSLYLPLIDVSSANNFTSIPWIKYYDKALADRFRDNNISNADSKRLGILKIIESEELKFLQFGSDAASDALLYGEWGESYRKMRIAQNSVINDSASSSRQAYVAAMVASVGTIHSQLSSYSIHSGNSIVDGARNLQANVNALNSMNQTGKTHQGAASAISGAANKFASGIDGTQSILAKYALKNSDGLMGIKAGSIGDLRYQLIQIYREETKNLQ